MKNTLAFAFGFFLVIFGLRVVSGGLVVPTEVQQPGTQPQEVGPLESPNNCLGCHGGYNTATEPGHNWRGSMMSHAARDPVFWAAVAIADQDFDGGADLCLRCHTPTGWLGGRSIPTDGSALNAALGDGDGVTCDTCHKMTNPDNSEWLGAQNAPFIANDKKAPATGYHGSAMYSMWPGPDKMGPYATTAAPHLFRQSKFHRRPEFCGTCHDVSNPVTGDLAPNNGRQPTSDPVVASGVLGPAVTGKAAFNNFPFQYGIVERTFSEHMASLLSKTPVSAYPSLPADLRNGGIKLAYESALAAGTGGNYEDGTSRFFTCQTCHIRPITGQGAIPAFNPLVRKDLPNHDMTGGNYWVPDAITYLDSKGLLRLGGGLSAAQIAALNDGKTRVRKTLDLAASLSASANNLRVVNLTGHKLISGYPEGRRMWLNMKWYDSAGVLLREDGRYGPLTAVIGGVARPVKTLLDLNAPNTKIYEAHHAMTQEWANKLLSLNYAPSLPLSFDRVTGAVTYTLGQLAAQAPGTYHETFHFILNNHVAKDNRIPPYGLAFDESRKRNLLPVPGAQYGSPGPGGTFNYWDDVPLSPPANAAYAAIGLMYQPTSWEYIQFLDLANNRQNAFLANEGANLLDAWLNTGMAEPYLMALTTWGGDTDTDGLADLWEQQFGLNPQLADADADPDGDGRTNRQEFQEGTHPRGFNTSYLAEGASSPFFDSTFALVNTSATIEAKVLFRYQLPDGKTTNKVLTVPASTRRTVSTSDQAGLAGAAFSTVVESDELIVVERTMAWDARGYGAHAQAGIITPSTTWFLAEGATHSGFQTFYLMQNPGTQPAQVTVSYLLPPPAAPVQKVYQIAGNSRFNIWVNDEARTLTALALTDVSARITSDRPITVERAMYLNTGGRLFGAGHASAGVTAAALNWFMAEGATGAYFDQFVLVANPNPTASIFTARFLLTSGVVITRQFTVAPNSRFNIWVDQVDPLLANASVATTVAVTNNVPVVVERSMWWPGPTAATWQEAHHSPAAAQTAAKWALADGEQGGARSVSTYILVANTGTTAGSVRVRLFFENGGTAERIFPVGATTRFDVDVGAEFPASANRRFAAIVESLGPTPAPIVVERSMYWNAEGVIWAAGTNVAATRLP